MQYIQLKNNEKLPQINQLNPFRCVVIIDSSVSQGWQENVSHWLVGSGCLYMMAWGNDCSSWDDSVDYANLDLFRYQEIPPESFVITTWHENELLADVFSYCKNLANHDVVNLENTLLLHISEVDMLESITQLYTNA